MFKVVKTILLCFVLSLFGSKLSAQESLLSIGVHMDWAMESPSYMKLYGIQGKYDLTDRQSIQAQIGLGDYKRMYYGADYLYTLLPLKGLPSVFVAAGLGYEGIRSTDIYDIIISGQVGLQFKIKRFSPYIGYKPKFYFEVEGIDATSIALGLRFRL